MFSIGIEELTVERKVAFVFDGSDIAVGEIVCAHSDGVFDRKMEGKHFDIIPHHEVFAILEQS